MILFQWFSTDYPLRWPDHRETSRSDSGQSWIEELSKRFAHDPVMRVRKFIASLNDRLEQVISNGGAAASQRREFAPGPPCRNYRRLKHFSEFAAIDELIMAAQSKLELDAVVRDWKDNKAALNELITQSRAATKRLESALDLHGKALIKKALDVQNPSKPSRASLIRAAASVILLFDGVGEFGLRVPNETFSSVCDFTKPAIFGVSVERLTADAPALVQACQAVVKNQIGRTDKRVTKRLVDDPFTQAEALLKPFLEFHYKVAGAPVQPPSGLDMHNFAPSLTWMAPDYKDQLSELNYLGTYRLQVLGSRKIVCVEAVATLKYLDKDKSQAQPLSTMRDVHTWLKTATNDNGKNYISSGGAMYHATLGPGDAMWLPPGWVYYDAAQAGKDKACINLRIQTLAQGHHDSLVKLLETLKKRGKFNSEKLAQIVDKLVLAHE